MYILPLTRAQITALLKQGEKERVREMEKDKDKRVVESSEQLNPLGNTRLDQRGGQWKASTPVKDESNLQLLSQLDEPLTDASSNKLDR